MAKTADNGADDRRRAVSAEISTRILAAQARGLSVREAMDEVLGAGSYSALVSVLYDALRAVSS